jgi:transposase
MVSGFEAGALRTKDTKQQVFFSYKSIEDRIPENHPIRALKILVDEALAKLSDDFDRLYSHIGRPSIPPEQLLRALLIQIFFSVRSERQLIKCLTSTQSSDILARICKRQSGWDFPLVTRHLTRLKPRTVKAFRLLKARTESYKIRLGTSLWKVLTHDHATIIQENN